MTTNHAAVARHARLKAPLIACTLFASLAVAGCESGNALFGSTTPAQPEAQIAQPPQPVQQAQAKIAVAPIIGAPDTVAKQLQQDFSAAASLQRVSVVSGTDKADYTLRGYIVAAKDRAGTKVSYIWDVTDPAGKRVNRITGEEILPATQNKDPWTAVTPQVTQGIAQKSAGSLAAWLPTAQSQAAIATAPATQPVGVGAQPALPANAQTAAALPGNATVKPQVASAGPTTASIGSSDVAAVVPSVTGAPGDGATALTQAIQGELTRNGVTLANQPTAATYRVEGVVRVGQGKDGKQPIQIDWNVKDPQGKKVGTVSQKNEIPEGSLDGAWGRTADAAAAAAAQGILKLLPGRSASN